MATISISISGTNGFAVTKTYRTDDANIPAMLAAYIGDPGLPSAVAEDGTELPRDASWAVDAWVSLVIKNAVETARQHQQRLAAAAAMAAVPEIVVTREP